MIEYIMDDVMNYDESNLLELIECDNRIEHILSTNMFYVGFLTCICGYIVYRYSKLEDELNKYKKSNKELCDNVSEVDGSEVDGSEVDGSEVNGSEVDGSEVDGSEVNGSEVDGSESDNDSDATDVVKESEIEGVHTRSWFS